MPEDAEERASEWGGREGALWNSARFVRPLSLFFPEMCYNESPDRASDLVQTVCQERTTMTSLRVLFAITRKEFRHIRRDMGFLFMALLAPAFLLLLFSYMFTFDVEHTRLGVLDQDRTSLSRAYVRSITADGSVEVVATPRGMDGAYDLLKSGKADAVLVIPHGFAGKLLRGEPSPVQGLVDGVDAIAAPQVIVSLDQRTQSFNTSLAGSVPLPLQVRMKAWFNPALKSQHGMVPALLPIVLILPAIAAALGMAREKESGTLETLLASPVRSGEYLIGKLLAYLVTGMIGALLAMAVARWWFHVPFRGELLPFLFTISLYLLAGMGLGMIVSSLTSSQQAATVAMLLLLFVPSFFLAGLVRPPRQDSFVSWAISQALPTTHMILISRAQFLKGGGLTPYVSSLAALSLMDVVVVLLGVLSFKGRLD